MEWILIAAAGLALVLLVRRCFEEDVARRALPVLLAAFGLRLLLHVLVMRNPVAGGLGFGVGDSTAYERAALSVVELWREDGMRFVTADSVPTLHAVAVPCNLFALVIYICGGPAPLACTALVALLACVLGIVMYRFALLVGADRRASFLVLVLTVFTPAFLLHTSDMFKDGFNALLVVTSLWLGASNLHRFDVRKLLALVPLLWALWHVRPYMVFMCALPLLLGLTGLRRVLSVRSLLVLGAVTMVIAHGGVDDSAPIETMQEQLAYGQADNVLRSNSASGSGVSFNDGGDPWADLGQKLAYTVLSPFPWTPGSLLLQLGKFEVLLWYFVLVSAVRGARWLWWRDRRIVWFLLLFIVPGTIVYATTMANIGLMMRQRMPIVMVTSLLAAVAWSRTLPGREGPKAPDARDARETRDAQGARDASGAQGAQGVVPPSRPIRA